MAETFSPTPAFSGAIPDLTLMVPVVGAVPIVPAVVPRSNASHQDVRQEARQEIRRSSNAASRLGIYSSLLHTLRAKHAPTAAHCVRVAQSISAWGLYHDVSEDDLVKLELTGLLHDIGKVGIPERILQKPGRLAPEERAIVELHPRVGVEILRSANVDQLILDSIEQIGVWFDQSNRVAKGPLPIAQRILSIADAFDAMTSEQVYRPAMSVKQSLAELERMGGTQFDQSLVSSFRSTVLNFKDDLARAVSSRWSNDSGTTFVHLFEGEESQNWKGSAAIESLNSVFHQNMMNRMNDGVIFIDTESTILEWNQAATRLTGLKQSSLLHSTWSPNLIGLSDENGTAVSSDACPISKALSTHETKISRFRIQNQDGRLLMVEIQSMPIFDQHGVLRGAAMLLGDASNQVTMEQKMVDLHTRATQDPLTKVANRSELNKQLKQLVHQCQTEKIEASVLICDIDYFKRINDTFGHAAGDDALVSFAAVLKSLSRESDLVARYGGEEFVILCMDCDIRSAVQIAESIREKLRVTPLDSIKGKTITASYGVSQIVVGDECDSALERADQGLLQAKQTGRDRVVAVSANNADQDSRNQSAPSETESTTVPAPKKSWFGWLNLGNNKSLIGKELLTNFSRDMVAEGLKGFVSDSRAELVSVDKDRVELRIDSRYAPMRRRESDRPIVFSLTLDLIDFELVGARAQTLTQNVTKLKLEVNPTRNRDRRIDNILDLGNRLTRSFETYLSAYAITDEVRERLIPVYKVGPDGQ
ncbi:MAG: diguanylate cyclase [Planctomycetota bacterium]|nr:diguanylate cyclase [Planctomycetota bacterium]